MLPGLGDSKSKFQVSLGWRISSADHSYRNNRLNHDFTTLWDPHERLSVLDVTAQYKINKRFNLTANLPVVFNKFSMLYPPTGPGKGKHTNQSIEGIGDVTLLGQGWLLNSEHHPFNNIALGVGIKIPTGNWNAHSFLPDETGKNFHRRTAYPPAIMPGDGGVGLLVSTQAFRQLRNTLPIIHGGTVYGAASYLVNARDTNGTPSMVSSLGVPVNPFFFSRLTNSVTDSYNAQVGIAVRIPKAGPTSPLRNARFRTSINWEGLPPFDLIGGSRGFRQPGYTWSVAPGFVFSTKRDVLSIDVPIVFIRHIDPNATLLPGLPLANGAAAPVNFNRQMGLVAPLSVVVRYARAI
jgi:hypothetical protein